MTTTTRPFQGVEGRPVQLVEVEGSDGRWSRVRSDSPAAQLAEMKRDTAALRQGMARVQAGIEIVRQQQRELIPMTIEIRSLRELETASLAGVLTRSQAYAYIEREAAQHASRHNLSKAVAIQQFCERNPRVYDAYRSAKDDPAPTPPPAATAARVPGTAEAAIDVKAKAHVAAHGGTYAAAVGAVCATEPDLYRRHLQEQRGNSR